MGDSPLRRSEVLSPKFTTSPKKVAMPVPDSEARSRIPRAVKKTAFALIAVLVCLIAVLVLLPDSVWRNLIVHAISHRTGRAAAIDGPLRLHLFSWNPELDVEGLRLANADWAGAAPMLTVKRIDVTVSLASLLRFEPRFPRIAVETPHIDVQRDAAGRFNWDFSTAQSKKGKPGAPLHIPVIQQLHLSDGSLKVDDEIRKLKFDGRLSVDAEQDRPGIGALSLRGSGMLNGKPFDLAMNGAPLLSVDRSHPYDFDASLRAADIKLNTHVSIAHPFDMGSVQARFDIQGADLADVYYLTGLALPNTPAYSISGTLMRDGLQFTIDDLHGKLGSSDIGGKLAIDTDRERPRLTAVLKSNELRLADLAAPLGAGPAASPEANGTLKPAASTAKALPPPSPPPGFLLPDADLQVGRVRGMDADVMFDAASVMTAKLPIKKLRFHLTLDDGKLAMSPLAFTLPQGQFAGSVSIDARAAIPQTDLDMKLVNVDMAQFKPKSSTNPPFEGQLLARIRLHGSGTSVHKAAATAEGDVTLVVPTGQMRAVLAELTGINLSAGVGLFLTKNDATTEVRCGVANFHASSGDLNATTFVIDTTHVLITGSGHIDMKAERLDLQLRGQPKEMRLFRLRTPIVVHGTLEHPQVGVQAGKAIGQAGGAAALATLLTPVAAVLAFVDKGLAKDANCAALLNTAEQDHNLHPALNK